MQWIKSQGSLRGARMQPYDAAGLDPSEILNTYSRIEPYLHPTRVVTDEHLSLFLKCENEQVTGSFKWRGALAKLSKMSAGESIVTASTGNHGLAVAEAARIFSLDAIVFVPAKASLSKISKIVQTGASLHYIDGDSLLAELKGKEYAAKHGLTWVSPYNDPDVIMGQGTLGIEMDVYLQSCERIYITVGGGGLISGIASWIKHNHPHIRVIGCQPENSPEMYLSIKAGMVVQVPEERETLSDGSAGPLETDSITFPFCSRLIDEFRLISEPQIKEAIKYASIKHQLKIEGAAGVALAAAMQEGTSSSGNAMVVLCGGNIDLDLHTQICN